jgi:hypothetical protein
MTVLPPLPAHTPVDVRHLWRALNGGTPTAPTQIAGWDRDVRMLPQLPGGSVTADPADVAAVVDGMQRRAVVRTCHGPTGSSRVGGRPIVINQTAAASCPPDARPDRMRSRLWLSVSYLDEAFVRDRIGGELPLVVFDEHDPRALAIATDGHCREVRATLEHQLADELLDAHRDDRLIVVDGSIADLPPNERLAGVVKDVTTTQWLADRSLVEDIDHAHLSPGFLIVSPTRRQIDRNSALLRLNPRGLEAWEHGLVRLETAATAPADRLERLAAWCLTQRQRHGGVDDPRWDRHLLPVRKCELAFRANPAWA